MGEQILAVFQTRLYNNRVIRIIIGNN